MRGHRLWGEVNPRHRVVSGPAWPRRLLTGPVNTAAPRRFSAAAALSPPAAAALSVPTSSLLSEPKHTRRSPFHQASFNLIWTLNKSNVWWNFSQKWHKTTPQDLLTNLKNPPISYLLTQCQEALLQLPSKIKVVVDFLIFWQGLLQKKRKRKFRFVVHLT